MKQPLIKYQVFTFVLLLCITVYTGGFNYAMLAFLLFWQILVSISIIRTCKIYFKTRKGTFVQGKLIESKENLDPEAIRYEILLEFYFPSNEHKYQLKHYSDLWPMNLYKIWVNTSAPQNSVVVEDVDAKLSNVIIFVLIVFSLFHVDYLYVIKIVNS